MGKGNCRGNKCGVNGTCGTDRTHGTDRLTVFGGEYHRAYLSHQSYWSYPLANGRFMASRQQSRGFIPAHGNYRTLLSYQKAEVIYDATFRFCERFLEKRDRTVDQMVQAA